MTVSGKPGNPIPDRYLHDADPAKGSWLTLPLFDGHRDIEGRLMCRQ